MSIATTSKAARRQITEEFKETQGAQRHLRSPLFG